MTKADFPYDPTLLEGMQRNLDRRRHQDYLTRLTPEQKAARQVWVDAIDAEEKSLGGKSKRPAPPLLPEDELILATLADASPVTLNQPDLVGLTGLPKRKIGNRMQWLESKRLVKRPEGTQRKGHAITAAGLSAIGRLAESVP